MNDGWQQPRAKDDAPGDANVRPAGRDLPRESSSSNMGQGVRRADVAAAVDALAGRPRVHALVAPVIQPFVADIASALGVDISMTDDAVAAAPMAAAADAVTVNLGMLADARYATATALASAGRPFVLDPVKVDRSPPRLALAKSLLVKSPAIVKGNAAEMAALAPPPGSHVSVTTGPADQVAHGATRIDLTNGDALLDRVTGTGCAAGVLMTAMLGAGQPPLVAATAGLSLMNTAAEVALRQSHGPGSFKVALIDALAGLRGDEVAARLRWRMGPPDLSVYLIVGPEADDFVGIAKRAVAGGVSIVQYRDKTGSTADQVNAVRALVDALPVPVLVNDRVDVALAAGAAGVHVGHGDVSPWEARQMVGDDRIVGITVHSLEEAEGFDGAPVDYASVGGVYVTMSKKNTNPPIGIEGFMAVCARLRQAHDVPICAIAGIDATRAVELSRAGADGVAVISAITKAADPAAAATTLLNAVREGQS